MLPPLNKIRCKVCACYDKLSRNLLNRNAFMSCKWCLMLLLGRSCSISFGNKLSSHTVNLCQTEHPEGRAMIKFTDGKLKHLYRREFLFIFVLAEQNPSAPEQKHHMQRSLCHSSQRSSINIIYFKITKK